MRVAGRLAAEVLDFITPHVGPGITTGELDRLCHEYMVREQHSVPAPLNHMLLVAAFTRKEPSKMSPTSGTMLLEEIAPRLRSVIPRCVRKVGAEDDEGGAPHPWPPLLRTLTGRSRGRWGDAAGEVVLR